MILFEYITYNILGLLTVFIEFLWLESFLNVAESKMLKAQIIGHCKPDPPDIYVMQSNVQDVL